MTSTRFFSMLVVAFFVFALSNKVNSQNEINDTSNYPYYINMMQDNNVNFYDVQRAAELYFANRDKGKGSGWKQYKRWEWLWQSRVDEAGNRPSPDLVFNTYNEFISNYLGGGLTSTGGNWVEMGPVALPTNGTGQPNGLGRVNGVAFHPSNVSTIWIAAPSGGLWKTTNGGTSWTVLTDTLPTLGVSSIVVHPTNTNTIYIGSGDRDGGDAPGMGVLKTTDGGLTWAFSNTGMGNKTVGDLLMHPANSSILIAAASDGIYKSIDAGASWTKKSSNSYHYKDIAFMPKNPAIMYATENGNFYKSTNTGDSWTQITSGLPTTSTRFVIGTSAADSTIVYILACASDSKTFLGLYKSTNGGTSFAIQSNSPNILGYSETGSDTKGQSSYDLCIAVSPTNASLIHIGGINIWKSTNGGQTWTLNAHWVGSGGVPEVHADIHSLDYNPLNGRLYTGCDGGIYYTANAGTTWTDISSGLAISQIYKLGQSASNKNLLINGYQDNGTAIYNAGAWSTEIGGDGMECLYDPYNTNYVYGSLYYGDIRRSSNGGAYFDYIAGNGTNGITEDGAWVTPFVLHVANTATMIAGYKNIWRSSNIKATSVSSVTWTQLTNNLGGTNSSNISVIEQSIANSDILYFARSDGKLFRSDNFSNTSPTFTDLTSGLPSSSTPKDLVAHPDSQNIVYMVHVNGVYKSTNKGASWTAITGNLPNISKRCLVLDTSLNNESLYVGTIAGVYYKNNTMSSWIPFISGMPASVEVTELEIYYHPTNAALSSIRAATYGRGNWQSDLYSTGAALPIADFSSNDTIGCTGMIVNFADNTFFSPTSWQWSFTPSTVTYTNGTSSTSQNPKVQFNAAGYYSVTLVATNINGNNTKTRANFVKVGGFQTPLTENFETTSATLGEWTIVNPDNLTTWALTTVAGNTPGTQAMYMNNYGYTDTARRDGLVTPPINLKGKTSVSFSFQHAYTRYTGYPSDSLIIYGSRNCGTTWVRLFGWAENGGGNFATYPNTTYAYGSSFTPAATTDWCGAGVGPACFNSTNISGFSTAVNAFAGDTNVMFKFENYNRYSNNLYIDNVSITGSGTLPVTASFTPSSTSICAGGQVTFTNTSQNATSYVWKQNGVTFSTQTSPVQTFSSAGTYQIKLVASNSTSADSVTQVITVNAAPGQAVLPTGTTSLCQNPSNTTYTTTGATNATSYTWNISPVAAGIITGNTVSAVVDWANTFSGIATVSVSGVNTCGTGQSSSSLAVNITALPGVATTPTGTISLCENPPNNTYTASTITGATSYNLAISPAGAGIITGTSTTGTVDWSNTYTGTATITVRGVNGCGNGSFSNPLTVTINTLPGTATVPTGPVSLCENAANSTYTVANVTSATSYTWTLTPSGAGSIISGGNSAIVDWNNTFTGSVTLTVKGTNLCGSGAISAPLSITINALPVAPATPSGTDTACKNGPNETYTITSVPTAISYIWSISPSTAGTITGTTTSAVADWSSTFYGQSTISVKATNSCGTGNASNNMIVNVLQGPAVPVITQSFDTLLSSSPFGNQWYYPFGPITGATNYYYIVTANSQYYVIVTDSLGCTSQSLNYNFTNASVDQILKNNSITVYPNPVNDILYINLVQNAEYQLVLYNVLGEMVLQSLTKTDTQLDLTGFASGFYYLRVTPVSKDTEGMTFKILID